MPELPFLLPFIYKAEGVRVSGKFYPTVRMQYLDAVPLNQYVGNIACNRDLMDSLIRQIENIAELLQEKGIAHGDLQHENILVCKNKIFLIDYDAMFVPELAGSTANELGNPGYQHPQKSARHFDKDMDRFSFWLIRNSLRIIQEDPRLLEITTKHTDGLLFSSSDLRHPAVSELFHHLESHESEIVRQNARQIRAALNAAMEETPALSDIYGMEALLELTPDLPKQELVPLSRATHGIAPTVPLSRATHGIAPTVPLSWETRGIAPTEDSFGRRTRHKWPEFFDHEMHFGYKRLNDLGNKQTPIPGELPFLPPLLAAIFDEHGVLMAMYFITAYACFFICGHPVTLVLLLSMLAVFVLCAKKYVLKLLTCSDSLRRGPRGRFLNRLSDTLYDGKCTLVKFRFVGPTYEQRIVFESGVPEQLLKSAYKIQNCNMDPSFTAHLCDSNSRAGMLYFDRGHTGVPIALCAEGNLLIWLI